MDNDKAIRAAKLTLGGMLENRRAKTAVERAQGQIAPSKYLPNVPRQVHANGGYVPAASLPIPKLAVARGSALMPQPTLAETLAGLASFGKMATGLHDTITDKKPSEGGDRGGDRTGGTMSAAASLAAKQIGLNERDQRAALQDYLTTGGANLDPATTAWCAAFVNSTLQQSGIEGSGSNLSRSFLDWGESVTEPQMGDLAVFSRGDPNGTYGHVGFFQGYDDQGNILVLGGNQGNAVSVSPYSAENLLGFRRANGMANGGSVMTPEQIEEQMALSDFELEKLQKEMNTVNRAGQFGSLVGKLTGIPFAGTAGRKIAEHLAMSKFADGGSVSDPRAAFLEGNHPLVPEVLYHGTARDIRSFDPNAKRSYDIDPSNPDETDTGWFGKGHYFTASPKMADHYADEGARRSGGEGANVMPVHVSMKNPFVVDMKEYDSGATTLDKALTAKGVPLHSRGWRKPSEQTAALIAMGHDGVIATREGKPKEYVAFHPHQIKSAISATTFDPATADITKADGGSVDGYTPQRTVKAYKLFRRKGDQLFPLFVHANKPVPTGQWLEAEEGPQGKAQGKVKSKLGDLAYRPGWHAGDLPIATHIGGKSSPDLKKPDYRPDDHIWAEIEMAADKDWQSVADSRGKGVKAHITDQVPLGGFYRYKTNPNMTGNWLIGGHMKVNRVLSDDEVKSINDAAGTADLPRMQRADGGRVPAMFEGMHEDLQDEQGNPLDLWHGTPAPQEFEAFDDAKVGSRDAGFYGRGHYLTPQRGNAEGYADPDEMGTGTVMGPLHAALKNPYIWDTSSENAAHRTLRDLQSMGIMRGKPKLETWDIVQRHEMDNFMRTMRERGHDGVIVRTQDHEGDRPHRVSEVVVFKPTAIKHKDAEVFDPTDPRIRRNDGGRVNLYSKAARIVSAMKDQKMDVQDILKYALGKGVKKTELAHVDVPSGKATPKQVADHIEFMQPQIGVRRLSRPDFRFGDDASYEQAMMDADRVGNHALAEELNREWEAFAGYSGEGEPLYARYQLPGGQNYREHILTLDSHPSNDPYYAKIHWGRLKNPLAHIRMSDRTTSDGRKILHIEELQSDWNNDARKHGFRTGTEWEDYQKYVDKMRDEAVAGIDPTASPNIRDALRAKYNTMDPYMLALKMGRQAEHNELARKASSPAGVPQAPYINPDRDDASEVAMKHILMEAAKGGYDGIAFTPDKAQEERWPGHTFKGIYDKKLPGMAERLVKTHDPDYGLDDMMNIGGWGAPMIPLSPEARDSINKNGFSSFRRGGYVTHVRRAR